VNPADILAMYHRNRLTLNEFENKLWPFPLGIADYPAGPAMDASRYRIVKLYDLSVEGIRLVPPTPNTGSRSMSAVEAPSHSMG